MTIYKKNAVLFIPTSDSNTTTLELKAETVMHLSEFLDKNPLTEDEKQINVIKTKKINNDIDLPFAFGDSRSKPRLTVPLNSQTTKEFVKTRENLPIYSYRSNILTAINENQVVVISGETGSGILSI